MIISKQSGIPVYNILCKGEKIKQVSLFKYLGFTITPDATCDTEIKKRMALSTKGTFTTMVYLHQQKCQNFHQNEYSESLHMVHAYAWMWRLDIDKRPRKKTRSGRNVVHQKNNENIKDWKEDKRRSNGNGWIHKIATQNHQKKTATIFWACKQRGWTRKANIQRKDLW